jgi:hypothetical protein
VFLASGNERYSLGIFIPNRTSVTFKLKCFLLWGTDDRLRVVMCQEMEQFV